MRRLIIRTGAIGDFVVSLPAMECLRTDYLEVWAPSRVLPLVRFAGRTRAIADTGLDLLGVTDAPHTLMDALRSFDSIVCWYGSNRPEFRDAMRGLPVTFFPALPAQGLNMHAAEFYLDQVRSIGPCESDGVPRIACAAVREDFAVIHPFSGSAPKNWPLDMFQALAQRLDMPVRWCRGEDDPPLDNAERIDDLSELSCWLARARLYIGNDSGITHLAAAVGTPVLAFFGPSDPAVWSPRGPSVQVVRF